MKKAQLTLFMLLGIVLLIVFGFLFYSTGMIANYQLNKRINRITEELLKTTALEYYITVCLDDSAKEGFNLVGRQGGVIYEDQGGWSEKTNFIPFEVYNKTNNVTYALTNPDFKHIFHPPPPEYPYKRFNDNRKWSKRRDNYYGTNRLAYLCDKDGPNKISIFKFVGVSCELVTYNLPKKSDSIQEQLAVYIANKTKKCVNFSTFSSRFGYNITEGENISAEVIYGAEDVIINLKYPLDIKIGKKDKVTKFLDFRTKLNIRFKTIYNLAHAIIENEIKNIDFKAEEDYLRTRDCRTYKYPFYCWKKGLDVRKFKDTCVGVGFCSRYDDLIQIIDNESLVNGLPFIFQFGIENRYPALDEIGTSGKEYDLVVIEKQPIKLKPIGYDPDEDNLTYNYSGWKEDYDEEFDFDKYALGGCPPPNLEDCVKVIPGYSPHNWTESEEFKLTKQNATYETQHLDIGIHNLTISIYDNEELKDWQNIKILVNDKPVILMEGNNLYDDLKGDKHNWASIEDPYILDATGTTVIFADKVTFTWIDEIPGEFKFVTPEYDFWLPGDNHNPDIRTITLKNFTIPGTHKISLTVDDGILGALGDATKIKEIEVKDCLPHKNSGYPYPYNTIVTNDFQADHTCCDNNGEYKSTECFRKVYYTCRPLEKRAYPPANLAVVDDGKEGELISVNPIYDIDFGTFPPASGDKNDIYLRTYTQQCSEKRGNACSGEITDKYVFEKSCGNMQAGETETCQGPCDPDQLGCKKGSCPGFEISPLECHEYSAGESFELNFENNGNPSGNINGICNENWRCSSNSEYGVVGGDFLAKAVCGGGKCNNVKPEVHGIKTAVLCSGFDGNKISGTPPYTEGAMECNYGGVGNIASVKYSCLGSICERSEWDLDEKKEVCENCHKKPKDLYWINSGEDGVGDYIISGAPGCCGDDNNEVRRFYLDSNPVIDEDDDACCSPSSVCVFKNKCYANGETKDVDGDGDLDTCTGRWIIT